VDHEEKSMKPASKSGAVNQKQRELKGDKENPKGEYLTTNQGVRVSDTDNSLKAGERGPTLMEDFHFREKMTHFDHERIPERVVHARGSAAHGYFQAYESHSDLTKAGFLNDTWRKTPVFVRFSTVVGFRGSADTVRDVRGFATKFYTEEGNYDLVGNNMPVFFIQDAIKFPDLVHAIKPEPHNQVPQASAAHDNFWDFISLTPESTHMIMWVLSDRALPRSYREMDGFGVHTFHLINDKGDSKLVKFHWRPLQGVYSLVWDETQKIAGKDPDYNRKDLWEAIESGEYPEYELCVQIVDEKDERKFDFDLLDPTKIIPEELVPLRPLGKMVLNRNPDNFFAETEQVAFHPGNLVPGIDLSNDPLLQGRLFSYLDTQLLRLGGPNFTQIPINRPVASVHNNQEDGPMRQTIRQGRVNYFPNSLGGNSPKPARAQEGGYVHYQEKIEGHKIRNRSESFSDHFSQATLFWNSMSPGEKQRIIEAGQFELGKVASKEVRQRMINDIFNPVDHQLACAIAEGIGAESPKKEARPNHGRSSPSLSLEHRKIKSIRTRKVAVLAEGGFDYDQLSAMMSALREAGAVPEVIAKAAGQLKASGGRSIEVDRMFVTVSPVIYDAVYIPGGKDSVAKLERQESAIEFLGQIFRHGKAIAATGEGIEILQEADLENSLLANAESNSEVRSSDGVITQHKTTKDVSDLATAFIAAIAEYRHWGRKMKEHVPHREVVQRAASKPQAPAPH